MDRFIKQKRQKDKEMNKINMSLNHSSFSNSTQLKDFQQTMANLKSPFIQTINTTKQMFQKRMKDFQQDIQLYNADESFYQMEEILQLVRNYRGSELETEENFNQKQNRQPTIIIPGGTGDALLPYSLRGDKKHRTIEFSATTFMKQWTGTTAFAFQNIEQAKQNFINVFHKKLSLKKKDNHNQQKHNYDYREDQKQMLLNIFHQLENPNVKGFATIEKIIEFFERNALFYLFYNIHPNRLKYVLKEFARTRQDSLQEKEFLLVFYLERDLLKDLSDPYEKVVSRKCILDAQGWEEMKTIFDTLDTFGNQTIYIYPFIKKLKAYHSNPSLIYTPVIEFPEIDRIYTLKKVVFDLEHKFSFDAKVKWADIQNLILNFNHKEEPTLDVIFEQHLEKGTILLDSNYFLIEKKVIELLKNTFQRCPKFCEFFVNTRFICNEILENLEIKLYFKRPIRQKPLSNGGYINLQEATRFMAAKAPQYIDLDQFLEYFSIKGPVTNVLLEKHDQITSTDEDNQNHDEKIKLLRRMRSLQKLSKSKKQKKSKKQPRQITDIQEFNLTKKVKQTIREKKVKQMLKQKEEEELKELKNKFKANPIPADLNPQRLMQEQKRVQMRKKKKFEEIAKRRQQEKEILSYLKANTKLFEPLNKQSPQKQKQANARALKSTTEKFAHKPVPWFVKQDMLQKIEKEKQDRKKKLYNQARIKYARSWNQLPDFFFKEEEKDQSVEDSLIKELKKQREERLRVVKANPVPDFKALQKQFEDQLESKKKAFRPTQIEEFRLTSPDALRKTHCNFQSPRVEHVNKTDWRKIIHSPPKNIISTTKKTEDWMNHNRKIEEEKRFVKQEEKFRQKERIMKQKNFAKFMSQRLKLQDKSMPNLGAQTAQKLRQHKETVQYLQRLTEKQLSQIYARVLQRPFLFETESEQQQMKKVHNVKKKGHKAIKKGIIKNIDAIDFSEESANKFDDQSEEKINYNNQYQDENYQHYEQENNHYDEESSRQHRGVNQSF